MKSKRLWAAALSDVINLLLDGLTRPEGTGIAYYSYSLLGRNVE
jgi:hypothetical protein